VHLQDAIRGPIGRPVAIVHVLQVAEAGERGIAAVAGAQRGFAHRSQLTAAGLRRGAIAHRVKQGALHHVFPSVYAVGHRALVPLGLETAALLRIGRNGLLSHDSAAAVWGLAAVPAAEVTVTVIARQIRPCRQLAIRGVGELDARDVRIRYGLPVTAPARTIIDLAAITTDSGLAEALAEARVLTLVTDRELESAMGRCPLRAGVRRLRRLMAAERGPALTRSDTERMLCALLDRGRLPRPQFNVKLHRYLVDAVWPAERLVIEADGFATHGHRAAFERDRLRDQTMAAHGFTTVRITWRQLRDEPMAVLARISMALAYARARA